MRRTLTLYSSEEPGFYAIKFTYDYAFKEEIKPYPGVRYAPEYDKGVWLAPLEAGGFLREAARKHEYEVLDKSDPYTPRTFLRDIDDRCYPFMKEIMERLAEDRCLDRGMLVNLDLGLGKCCVSIQAFRCFFKGGAILVATPVRATWHAEIEKWDGRLKRVEIIKSGAEANDVVGWLTKQNHYVEPHYFVTSYELLKHFAQRDLSNCFDMVVADEVHMLANPKTGRTKAWAKIRKENPEALALGLTGTPVPDRVPQLAPQVSAIWPTRFGSKWKFTTRYHHCIEGEYGGLSVGDVIEERLPELKARLAAVSVRITKDEVAHLLPKLTAQRVEIPYKLENRAKALALAEENYEEYLLQHSNRRIKEAADWIENTGQSHVCAVTYHIDTARRLSVELQDRGYRSSLVTGKQTQEKRLEIIEESLTHPQHFLVCSMKSIGVGVNVLAGYSTALFVELSYRPVDVAQTIGRFYRLNSLGPVLVAFLVLKGTLDDVLIDTLMPKVEQFAAVLKEGVSETEMRGALQETESDDDFFARMREVAGEEDE